MAKQGYLEKALEHFSAALMLKLNYAEAHNNMGIALYRQRKLEKATYHFKEALRINPDYDNARYNLNTVLRKSNTQNSSSIAD